MTTHTHSNYLCEVMAAEELQQLKPPKQCLQLIQNLKNSSEVRVQNKVPELSMKF